MDAKDSQDQVTLIRLDELQLPRKTNQRVKVDAITRATARRCHLPQIVQEEIVQQKRLERIKQARKMKRVGSLIWRSIGLGIYPRLHLQMRNHLPWSRQIIKSIRTCCCSFVPDRPQSQKIAQNWFDCDPKVTAARLFAPLSYQSGGRPQRYRPNLSEDQSEIPLERSVSKCTTFCGKMCGLWDR